ncbi:MAG TPA: FHA domain-containing protein [Planctomycetaceae bacterium]|nr:FHA domain-containing protein [Planctomycetaceae bacterium]
MTGYDSDSSLQLSGEALKKVSVENFSGEDSVLNFSAAGEAWSFDPSDSDSLEVLITDESGHQVEQHRFNQPFILIGRSSKCDLNLQDESVSFRHAYLQRMYGRVLCVDLASRSGTHWEQRELPYGWFDEHHPIRIGPYHLRLNTTILEDEPDEPEFDPRSFFRTFSNQAVLPRVSIQQLARSGPGESWTINRPITLVGSSSRCRLKLSHKSVSKVHCSLLLMPDGLWVVDLLGKDGTFVDGQPVRYTRIADGSSLKVGRFTFRVACESEPARLLPNLAAASAAPAAASSGVSEEFVLQLMRQVTNMQQQFLIQSQQQSEMMLQFFGTMHAGQHKLLSEEMARLHEINREMRELKQQLQQTPRKSESRRLSQSAEAAGAHGAENPVNATTDPASTINQPAKPPEADRLREQFELLRHQLMQHKAAPPKETTAEKSEAELVAEANWRLQKAADLDRSAIEIVHPQEDCEETLVDDSLELDAPPPEAVIEEDLPEESEPEVVPAEKFDVPEQDHHAWVLDRMHKLENERKGLFRKMLQSLFTSNG